MLNLRRLQDKKISAKHSEIDIESEGKELNLRWLRNRKIFVTSERSSGGGGLGVFSSNAKHRRVFQEDNMHYLTKHVIAKPNIT